MKKVVIGFSGGKDSTLALFKLQKNTEYEIDSLLVTLTEGEECVTSHGVRFEMLKLQSESLGLTLREVRLPRNCSNEKYEEMMKEAISQMRDDGVTQMAFGDIHLQDIREYREKMLSETGMTALFPLWGMSVEKVSKEFINIGFKTILTCIDLDKLDKSFAGRVYDQDFIQDYPKDHDICGESGEFHSFVFDGPNFKFPVPFELGEQKITPDYFTKKDRFLCIDLVPVSRRS